MFLPTQGEGQYLAKDLLLGAKVYNAEGHIIGDIEDLILNADNQVEGVVMGTGGFAGFGEKRIAVISQRCRSRTRTARSPSRCRRQRRR